MTIAKILPVRGKKKKKTHKCYNYIHLMQHGMKESIAEKKIGDLCSSSGFVMTGSLTMVKSLNHSSLQFTHL